MNNAVPLHGRTRPDFAALRPLAEQLFTELAAYTQPGAGLNRPAYDAEERQAMDHVAAVAEAEGLATEWDRAGNLWITLPGGDPDAPFVACGSHLDSVPEGGQFDGSAGVIAALLALVHLKRSGQVPPRTIKAVALRAEESAYFGPVYIGSRALFGGLTESDLASCRRDNGRRLDAYMADAGVDVAALRAGETLLDPAAVAAFIELHIEQGPVMVARKLPVGIVTGIRGAVRHHRVVCRGVAGHSGAVPRWLRHDAVFAVSELIGRVDEHWRVLLERGVDLVVTAGICSTDPANHALTRIPGEVTFSLDVRSADSGTLESFYLLLQSECARVGAERGVSFEFDERSTVAPARMDDRWVRHLEDAAGRLDIACDRVPSGAGHDASVFANAGVPAVMLFVRNEHGSHNPDEAMAIDDFMAGARVLCAAVSDPVL